MSTSSSYNSLLELLEAEDVVARNILAYFSFIELHKLRECNNSIQQLVTSYLDRTAPSLVVLGGLDIELDDDDERSHNPAIISSSVNAFRFATMQWYTLPSLPTPRFSCAVCTLLDGRIVVAGGISSFEGSNECANPSCFVEEGRSMHGQPDMEAGDLTWRGRNSQRGGRFNDGMSDVVEVFDPFLGTWSTFPPLSKPRAGAKACLNDKGDCIFIIGGSVGYDEDTQDSRDFSHDVEIFHVPTSTWIDNKQHQVIPHMNNSRSDFALSRIEGKGILVIGGTNRYLWPNSPLTAELYHFQTNRWETLPAPPNLDYAPKEVSKPEQMGCECVTLQGDRYVIVHGGMRVDPSHFGTIPMGSGNEEDSQNDVWFHAENIEDDPDDYFSNGYDARLNRSAAFDVYDLKTSCWLEEEHPQHFQGLGTVRAGTVLFNPIGNTVVYAGGNYEFFSGNNTQYPSHGSSAEVFVIDGPRGKPIMLPWPKWLPRQVTAAGTARLDNLKELVEKHGWQDLRVDTQVELHGMKTESYNGKRGIIVEDIGGGATGRWGVLLQGSKKPISVRAECLRQLQD